MKIEIELERLVTFFDKKMNAIQTAEYLKVFALNVDIARQVVDELIQGEQRFPPLAAVHRKILELREQEWRRQKARAPGFGAVAAERGAPADYARDARHVIATFLDGEVSRAERVKLMRAMDEAYPGLGWREAADSMEKFYAKRAAGFPARVGIWAEGEER
jgi:hypothetical protein